GARRGELDRTRPRLARLVAGPCLHCRSRTPASTGGREGPTTTSGAQPFAYVPRDPSLGNASLAPMLPLTLIGAQGSATTGLVDSGAAINVLPHALGVQLGFDWEKETRPVELSGNLAAVEARVVVLSAVVESFPPVRL